MAELDIQSTSPQNYILPHPEPPKRPKRYAQVAFSNYIPHEEHKLTINPEYLSLVPRPTDEEYKALEADIVEKGRATEPIKINSKNEILDGHTRYEICEKHNLPYDTKTMSFPSVFDEKIFVVETNLLRRNLTPYQRFELNLILAPFLSKKGEENMLKGTLVSFETRVDTIGEIADRSGLGRATAARAMKIDEEGLDSEKQKARSGQESISKVFNKIQRREKLEFARDSGSPPLPEGKYDIILADPPWQYGYEGSERGKADIHYATIPTQELCNHPIKNSIADNALLFLWVTNPLFEDGLKVVNSWGFKYITNFVWVKDKIGLGFWNRAKHELLFICKKGDFLPPADADRLPSVIDSPRREHSQKPDVVYDMIEKMYPHRHYLELFSRNKREGWTMWGLETNDD